MKLVIALMLCLVLMTGCIYTHVTMPYSIELNKTELGHKRGEASMQSVLWLFAWGDAGAARAAQNGDVAVLTHMDRELLSVLFGFYTRNTTIVYGD